MIQFESLPHARHGSVVADDELYVVTDVLEDMIAPVQQTSDVLRDAKEDIALIRRDAP